MRSFLIRYDFSKVASGKLLETVIIRGEVTVISDSVENARENAIDNGLIPQFIVDNHNCIEVWEHSHGN